MLVKNVHIHNREGLWQILIEEGKISRIFPQDEVLNYSGEILDGEEGIVSTSGDQTTVINDVLFSGDHFHPNNIGYQIMSDVTMEKISETKEEWKED